MAVNKIVRKSTGDVLLDLTQDTVTAETLPLGVTAHNAAGEPIVGEYKEDEIVLQNKTITPTTSQQSITADSGYDGLSRVTIEGDANLVAGNIKSGVSIFGVTGTLESGSGSGSGINDTVIVTVTANFNATDSVYIAAVFVNGIPMPPGTPTDVLTVSAADGSVFQVDVLNFADLTATDCAVTINGESEGMALWGLKYPQNSNMLNGYFGITNTPCSNGDNVVITFS